MCSDLGFGSLLRRHGINLSFLGWPCIGLHIPDKNNFWEPSGYGALRVRSLRPSLFVCERERYAYIYIYIYVSYKAV